MTHDPLCPYRDGPKWEDFCPTCGLIAKVRKETLAAAVQRVEALRDLVDAGFTYSGLIHRSAVIDAIRILAPHLADNVASLGVNEWIEFDLNGTPEGPYATYLTSAGNLYAGGWVVRWASGIGAIEVSNVRRVSAPEVK